MKVTPAELRAQAKRMTPTGTHAYSDHWMQSVGTGAAMLTAVADQLQAQAAALDEILILAKRGRRRTKGSLEALSWMEVARLCEGDGGNELEVV